MKRSKWQLHRAGILNFWYYDEEEFYFDNGKLLLRGSNGSGKSVTMQSLIPVLLDGRKSPDRLDPFGSRARKMEDYLLGERGLVDRDERTGYLYLEYKREGLEQYLTTGIGLRAKRHSPLEFWGFIINDNRRIGKDLWLYEKEYSVEDGREQKIPLSRRQLETKVADGGRVVKTQREYMELVNKYVFGFENIEAYEDLIKLLIQLRSPKLSKDFKPTVIYEILTESLPALSDDELRPLSDTIENMDQTKQQLEQLEREKSSLSRLCQQYDIYNQYILVEKADGLLRCYKNLCKMQSQVLELERTVKHKRLELQKLNKNMSELEAEQQTLKDEEKSLRRHEVFNAEETKKELEKKIADLQINADQKERILEQKQAKERELDNEIKRQEQEIGEQQKQMNKLLDELELDAREASFESHNIAVEEFKNTYQETFHFDLWNKDTAEYLKQLDHILNTLREQTKVNDRYKTAERDLDDAGKNLDIAQQEEFKWFQFFEEEKDSLLASFHTWVQNNSLLTLSAEAIQHVLKRIMQIFEAYQAEEVKEPVDNAYHTHYTGLQKKLLENGHQVAAKEEEIAAKELELAEWKQKKDPEPRRHSDTDAARQNLLAQKIPHLPFYRAVEFKREVSLEDRDRIEAAVTQMGILDALIVPEKYLNSDNVGEYDRVIKPNPHIFAHTLADFLYPTPVEGSGVSAEDIDNVLRSILIADADSGPVMLKEDGSYKLALISGHAPREKSIYIGQESRRQYRLQMIEMIKSEIYQLQNELAALKSEGKKLIAEKEQLDEEYRRFPALRDIREVYDNWYNAKQLVKVRQEEVDKKNQLVKNVYRQLQEIKALLRRLTAEINLPAKEEAYTAARVQMQNYQTCLHKLELTYREYVSSKTLLKNNRDRFAEITADVDELKGEVNVLQSKIKALQTHLKQVIIRLDDLGLEEIRARIDQVLQRLEAIPKEMIALSKKTERTERDVIEAEKEMLAINGCLKYVKQLVDLWKQVFQDDLKLGFVVHEDRLIVDEEQELLAKAKEIVRQYASLLQDKSVDRLDMANRLNSIFYQEQGVLAEYRLTQEQLPEVTDLPQLLEDELLQSQFNQLRQASRRIQLLMEYNGKKVSIYYALRQINKDIELQKIILTDKDRELYEEIIMNSVGRIIRQRINRAEGWVKQINELMEQRDTSSGLTFSIRWKPRTADCEEELDTEDLVDLLRSDPRLLKDEDIERVTQHFRTKINQAKKMLAERGCGESFHQLIKDILDYRQWFAFTLYYRREGEQRKELTNNVFYTFSGGEKAMAMYIPLFSAAYSRYMEARDDAPYIISLDEAFAGVDENNIRDMFDLVESLGFNYIMNSQSLWGDYDTVTSLAICELVRPKNAPYVSVVRYHWDGQVRHLLNQQ